jgi:hypothetical protein
MSSYRIAIIPGDGVGNEVASKVNTPGMGKRIRPMKSMTQSRSHSQQIGDPIPSRQSGIGGSLPAARPEPSWYRAGRKGHSPVKGIPIRSAYSLFTPPAKGTGSVHFTGPAAIMEAEVW